MYAIPPSIAHLINRSQASALRHTLKGEEGQAIHERLEAVAKVWADMPHTYQTDGQGKQAVAQIHLFHGSTDIWLTEKDIDTDGEGQIQAFGLTKMFEVELGYVNIPEAVAAGMELDLFWTPKTLGEIRQQLDA